MKKPINQRAEALYMLLTRADMTTRDFVQIGIMNPTSVMTSLRRVGVTILCDNQNHTNKFGRKITYGKFNVLNRREAKHIYKKVNSEL
jgi:chemotaxis receptor (MCP) glutamine deamidase CheD